MNDLMTKSFLSYVELKKQVQQDIKSEEYDVEKGNSNPKDEENLSQYFQEIDKIKAEMEDITNLLFNLQTLNDETKSTPSTKLLRGLRDRMDSDMVLVLRKTKIVKEKLEKVGRSNLSNRKISEAWKEGSCVDRARVSVSNGLRVKLREMMNDFQSLREQILADYKESLKRRYYNATGEEPSETTMETLLTGKRKVEVSETRKEVSLEECKERHEDVMDIQRSLNKLHQLFLDMAVLVEKQGKDMDDVEQNVVNAVKFVNGGTNSIFYAKQLKKKKNKRKKWVFWVWIVGFIILLVCFISMLGS